MKREEVLIAGAEKMRSAENEALGFAFDEGFSEGRAEGVAAAQAGELPADVTPFSQEDMDKAVDEATASLKAKIADLELDLSKKDTDALEESIADEISALAQKLRDRTVKSAPVEESGSGSQA